MEPSIVGKVPVWPTTQAPGAYEGKPLTTKAVSESYDKARIADLMFGLMEGEVAPADGDGDACIEGIITKNRLTRAKRWRFYLEANLGTCKYRESAAYAGLDE
ncbi:MAG: hypothetical protein ACOYOB_19560 [Myxococcota bacterium]